jgi:hypothetical protein
MFERSALEGIGAMNLILTAVTFSVLLAAGVGAVFACNHDILCPDDWVWSDDEGTCVEAPEPGTT